LNLAIVYESRAIIPSQLRCDIFFGCITVVIIDNTVSTTNRHGHVPRRQRTRFSGIPARHRNPRSPKQIVSPSKSCERGRDRLVMNVVRHHAPRDDLPALVDDDSDLRADEPAVVREP
jgi:hypothetical protein